MCSTKQTARRPPKRPKIP